MKRTPMALFRALAAPVLIALLTSSSQPGEASPASESAPEVRWDATIVWQGDAAIERIRSGRPDRSDPRLQLIGVDQAGNVVRIRFIGDKMSSEVVYRHGSELTGIAIADVDPSFPGEEIYVGGASEGKGEGTGGAVLQIVLGAPEIVARRIYTGSAYVHAMEPVRASRSGDPTRLLVTNYAGELHLLTPGSAKGPWEDQLIYRDTHSIDPGAVKIKDVALLQDATGRAPHVAMAATQGGRVIVVDLDRPSEAKLVHEEPGGMSRVSADALGGAFLSGYYGRILHLTKDGRAFKVEAIHHEARDSGLRGASLGRFPVTGGAASLATFGFFELCRLLTPRLGAWDATTIYRDQGRGHALEAADLVPGNDADEIAVGGYSNRITVLVSRRLTR